MPQPVVISGWQGLDLSVSEGSLPLTKSVYAQDTANPAGRPGVLGPRRGINRAWANGVCAIRSVTSAMFRGGIRKRLVTDGCGEWEMQTVPYDPPNYGTQPGYEVISGLFTVNLSGTGPLNGEDEWILPVSYDLADYAKAAISLQDDEAFEGFNCETSGTVATGFVVAALWARINGGYTQVLRYEVVINTSGQIAHGGQYDIELFPNSGIMDAIKLVVDSELPVPYDLDLSMNTRIILPIGIPLREVTR